MPARQCQVFAGHTDGHRRALPGVHPGLTSSTVSGPGILGTAACIVAILIAIDSFPHRE